MGQIFPVVVERDCGVSVLLFSHYPGDQENPSSAAPEQAEESSRFLPTLPPPFSPSFPLPNPVAPP